MSTLKWTKDKVLKEALKFTTKREFITEASGAYAAAKRYNIVDEACEHMVTLRKTKWTLEEVSKEAKKYTTRTDFMKLSSGAYQHACKSNYLDSVCEHMSSKFKRITMDEIVQTAKKYTTIAEFRQDHERLYEAAQRRGLLKTALGHLTGSIKIWTIEELIIEAKKYSSKTLFYASNESAYIAANKLNIMNDICTHMSPGTRVLDVFNIPSKTTGLYFLYHKEKIVYIGKSGSCIHSRIIHHMKSKEFDKVEIRTFRTKADIDVMELFYINKYTPTYNMDSNSKSLLSVLILNEDDITLNKTTYKRKNNE